MGDLDNYHASENPSTIPQNYKLCEQLGRQAIVDLYGTVITCTANCPYKNQSEYYVIWDAENIKIYFCLTKGLVKRTQQEKSQ